MIDSELKQKLNRELAIYRDEDLFFKEDGQQISIWNDRFSGTPLVDANNTINNEALVDFRKLGLFVDDSPSCELNDKVTDKAILNIETSKANALLRILQKTQCLKLLIDIPMPDVGNPNVYTARIDGKTVRFTYRWAKHLYSLAMYNRLINQHFESAFINLDIGSSYGMFQQLVKIRRPDSHHVLVDFSEQLLLARYYLQTCFPTAKIAGIEELMQHDSVERDFISQYDFVLLPTDLYQKLADQSIDLACSFACLGELKREVFKYYTDHPAFMNAKVYFLANPIAPDVSSRITRETDVSLLDYKCMQADSKLHFGESPIHSFKYGPTLDRLQPFFEYIGTNPNITVGDKPG